MPRIAQLKKCRFEDLSDITLNLDHVESVFIKNPFRLSYFVVGFCYKLLSFPVEKPIFLKLFRRKRKYAECSEMCEKKNPII